MRSYIKPSCRVLKVDNSVRLLAGSGNAPSFSINKEYNENVIQLSKKAGGGADDNPFDDDEE